MRIVVVGATGTIGKEIVKALEGRGRHEIVPVSHSRGEHRVDLASRDSIAALFAKLGSFDALVSAAGNAKFAPLAKLTDEDFAFSLGDKLMGQVNLVRLGAAAIRDGGSFTLTSGVLAGEPMPGGAAVSVVNAGVEAFVRAAALELPRGVRVNAVSPPWVTETMKALGMDPTGGLDAAKVAAAYVESVEGRATGTVIDARRFR